MTLSKLTENLKVLSHNFKEIGYCYGNFPDNQQPPYIAYQTIESNPINADGICIYCDETLELNVMTKRRDLTLERAIEGMLRHESTTFTKSNEMDAEQKICIVTYRFIVEEEKICHLQ